MNKQEKLILQEYKKVLPHQQNFSKSNNIKIKILFVLLALLKLLFPKNSINRFEKSIKFYLGLIDLDTDDLNIDQKPQEFLYLGITSKPWYESYDYEILKFISNTLEKGFKDIEKEWLNNCLNNKTLVSRYKRSDLYPSLKKDDWGNLILWKNGYFTKAAYSLFPKTVKILSEIKCFLIPFGEAVFLVLKPGVALPPHHDDSNLDITCQLGLIIPDNCAIRVGGETRTWVEGKTLFFDHSFEHEAWNNSDKQRVVLLLDLYHPELTKIEKLLLWIFAKALAKY
jgi:aspartate beta-hydroxylase